MALYVVRLWLPDRPGALGQVAGRIGAVRGDVVGIEILERGGGRAVDELVVALPDDALVELLVAEITQVDGVDVEDVRPIAGEPHDAQVEALLIAERLAGAPDADGVLAELCEQVAVVLECDWVCVLALEPATMAAATGEVPSAAWLAAFLTGTSHLDSSDNDWSAPPDLVWAALRRCGLELVAGRRARPYRSRERRHVAALARVADALARRSGVAAVGAGRPGPARTTAL